MILQHYMLSQVLINPKCKLLSLICFRHSVNKLFLSLRRVVLIKGMLKLSELTLKRLHLMCMSSAIVMLLEFT